jgi:glycosyltransferase involved in cell wall biosynthesis
MKSWRLVMHRNIDADMKSPPRPYFEQPGFDSSAPRLLIISAAFPPSAGAGAVRLERVAERVSARGWQVDAITSAIAPHERYDDSRLAELPPGTRVWTVARRRGGVVDLPLNAVRVIKRLASKTARNVDNGGDRGTGGAVSQPGSADSVVERIRRYRDFRQWLRWAADAAELGRLIGRASAPIAVLSSGPPHIAHEAARRAARALASPLACDFRDPWINNDADVTPHSRAIEYERRVCHAADLVILNTFATLDAFANRYPGLREKMTTVMNGADPEVRAFASVNDTEFLIVHAGDLYGGRDPRPFFRGVRRFVDNITTVPHDVRVIFVGADVYEGVPLASIAASEGVGAVFQASGPVSRREALLLSGRAAVNVVLQQNAKGSIPSKVYDYVQFPCSIVALGQAQDAIGQLLEGTSAFVIDPAKPAEIARALQQCYAQWKAGERPEPMNADGRFDRSRQLEQLLDGIQRIAEASASASRGATR